MITRSQTWLASILVLSGAVALAACSSAHDGNGAAPGAQTQTPRAATATIGRPAWATPDSFLGRVAGDEHVDVQVHLRMRDEAGAEAELAAISDPASPRYGQFLTDAEFDAKYAPTPEDVAALRTHLESNGLRVTYVPENRAFVSAQGDAQAVERAFSTRLGHYGVSGTTRRAPMDEPSLPAKLQSSVLGVFGLSTPVAMKPRYKPSPGVHTGGIRRASLGPKAANDVATCAEWFGQKLDTTDPPYGTFGELPYAPCGYKPGQLRDAYGFATSIRKGNDGSGQTIAIVDAFESPTLLQDAQTYAAQNDPDYPLSASQFSAQLAPGTPSPVDVGWYAEQTLDVEAAHALAPGAKIAYVGAQSATDKDLVAAINLIITKRLASVVSNSYGSIEDLGANQILWQATATQAGLKGIGLFFSSGDNGDETAGFGGQAFVDFPASLPNVTAVGGTSLGLGQTGQRLFELGWETGASFLETPPPPPPDDGGVSDAGPGAPSWSPPPPGFFAFGAGGGTSLVYAQPSYQVGIVPPSIANAPGVPARAVPDVALLADPITGFVIGQTDPSTGTYSEFTIGGTSLASPLFTATVSLAQQHARRAFGFANPLLYKAYKHGAFRDVKPGDTPRAAVLAGLGVVTTFEYPGLTIHTAEGYDNETGLGVPDGANFLKAVQ